MSVSESKLSPPRVLGDATVPRTGLLASLAGAPDWTVALVLAPAGYGKTTLCAEWHQQLRQAAARPVWLTLDRSDNDPVRFLKSLTHAISLAVPDVRKGAKSVIDFGLDINLEVATRTLINLVKAHSTQLTLFLDDAHEVGNKDVMEILSALTAQGAGHIRFVIISRQTPGIRLGKLRMADEVLEVTAKDLAFSTPEAQSFFARQSGLHLTNDQISVLRDKVEGWAAGLRLAALALKNRHDTTSAIAQFSGAMASTQDFLNEEVFLRLPDDLQEFLLQTSILGQLTASLCNHLTGRRDAADVLLLLERENLFVTPLDEQCQWYRYHRLFSDFLRNQLDKSATFSAESLHAKAAQWYHSHNRPVDAVEHMFQSGDMNEAAQLLDRLSEALFQGGHGMTLITFSSELPEELLANYPRLWLERVYAYTVAWRFSEARCGIERVRQLFNEQRQLDNWRQSGIDPDFIYRKLVHRETQLAILMDDMTKAARLAKQCLTGTVIDSRFETAVSMTSLIYAEREQFDCHRAGEAESIREIFLEEGKRWGTVWHDCIIGATHFKAGDIGRAERVFTRAYITAKEILGEHTPTAAMPALHLAEIAYEHGDFQKADFLIDRFLPLATRTGLVDQLVAGFLTRARLARRAGKNLQDIMRIFDDGAEIALARNFSRLNAAMLMDRIRFLLAAGQKDRALQVARVNGIDSDMDGCNPQPGMTTGDSYLIIAKILVATALGQLVDAERVLRKWLRFLQDRDCSRPFIRFSLLLAQIELMNGDPNAAKRTIRSALNQGMKGNFLTSFADAPEIVRTMIIDMPLLGGNATPDFISYVNQVISACGGHTSLPAAADMEDGLSDPVDSLSHRETEILALVGVGLMNSQISDEIGLTLGTVKWYLQQIYRKLGVKRRSEAVFKARQLGLIS